MSRLVCVTPWSQRCGRHLWEKAVFEDSQTGDRVPLKDGHKYLGNLYAEGKLTLEQLEREIPFVLDQQDRNQRYACEE